MTDYSVEWRIEIPADTPEEAARQALRVQRDPGSMATVFHLYTEDAAEAIEVDLSAINQVTCPVAGCGLPFTTLTGGATGCNVHGIREAATRTDTIDPRARQAAKDAHHQHVMTTLDGKPDLRLAALNIEAAYAPTLTALGQAREALRDAACYMDKDDAGVIYETVTDALAAIDALGEGE